MDENDDDNKQIRPVYDMDDGTVFWAEEAMARAMEDGDAQDVTGFVPVRLVWDDNEDAWRIVK